MKAPILKGEKIVLRPISIKEAASYVRWIKDKRVNRFLIIDGKGLTLEKEKKIIKQFLESKASMNWSIFIQLNKLIGTTGITVNKIHRRCSWGIFIGDKNYWGQGYGADVLETVLKYCFNKLELNRVELSVFPFNPRAIECYKKCGFRVEGVKKQAVRKDGKFVDDIIMGILKKDYNKLNKKDGLVNDAVFLNH